MKKVPFSGQSMNQCSVSPLQELEAGGSWFCRSLSHLLPHSDTEILLLQKQQESEIHPCSLLCFIQSNDLLEHNLKVNTSPRGIWFIPGLTLDGIFFFFCEYSPLHLCKTDQALPVPLINCQGGMLTLKSWNSVSPTAFLTCSSTKGYMRTKYCNRTESECMGIRGVHACMCVEVVLCVQCGSR